MLEKKLSVKCIGIFILIPSILVGVSVLIATLILSSFGLASGVSVFQLIPFFTLMSFGLFLSGFCLYVSIRYLKGKPFKANSQLGTIFVLFSFFYLPYSLLVYLLNFFIDNGPSVIKPLFALLIFLILFPLGLGLKNGYKKA